MRGFESGGSWARPATKRKLPTDTEFRLLELERHVLSALDAIHDEFLRNMDWLARSVEQRTRVDR